MGHVRQATSEDLGPVVAVLADAFVDDPLMAWVYPEAVSRPRLLQAMFGFLAERRYLPLGECTVVDDAAALWLSPSGGLDGDEFWTEHGEAFVAAVEGQVDRLGALAELMGQHHPTDAHWYLLAIGVRPSAQGRGIGGSLLERTLARADAAGESAYLEATSLRSRVLYERHGFDVITELSVEDSPPLWPMWRTPRREFV